MPDYLKATANVPASFSFNGRRVRPGDPFVCYSPRLTVSLLEMGVAVRDERYTVEPGPLVPVRRDVIASPPASAPRKRGRYKRRDLRAEDDA